MSDAQYLIEAEVDGVKYVFSEPPFNDYLVYCDDRTTIGHKQIFERLVRVEGLKDAAGNELTADDARNIYKTREASFSTRVMAGFWRAWNKRMFSTEESDAKK